MKLFAAASQFIGGRLLCPLLPLLLLTVASCSKSKLKDQTEVLERSVQSVCKHIRWGHWDQLNSLMRQQEGIHDSQPLQTKLSLLEDIRVTNCDTRSIDVGDLLLTASAVADIQFHTANTVSIKKMRYIQSWWQDVDSGRWHLSSGFPDFCEALANRHKSCN